MIKNNFVRQTLALLAVLLSARAEVPRVALDADWQDTAGNEIQAQGGGVLKAGDTFYWYGVEFAGETPKQVRCYTSKDLMQWTFARPVLTQQVTRRVKVLYNPEGKQFVIHPQ
jgi:hypothetical protein